MLFNSFAKILTNSNQYIIIDYLVSYFKIKINK